MSARMLIIGACGQIGTELTLKLREIHGNDQVLASDIHEGAEEMMECGPFEILNATDEPHIRKIVQKYELKEVYLMAAMLSANAEKAPMKAWDLNMDSLFHILNLGKEGKINKIFWPSSIAVFGPSTPKERTPQTTGTCHGIWNKQTSRRKMV